MVPVISLQSKFRIDPAPACMAVAFDQSVNSPARNAAILHHKANEMILPCIEERIISLCSPWIFALTEGKRNEIFIKQPITAAKASRPIQRKPASANGVVFCVCRDPSRLTDCCIPNTTEPEIICKSSSLTVRQLTRYALGGSSG